jgi:hypothetical protein
MNALKVGELARRAGLTVRTLHHYDAIGLLRPSLHTETGHRPSNQPSHASPPSSSTFASNTRLAENRFVTSVTPSSSRAVARTRTTRVLVLAWIP